MDVVIYGMLLVGAFGAGLVVSWYFGLTTKFVSHRQLDWVLAEQKSLNEVLDREITLVARQHRSELKRFDEQLYPDGTITTAYRWEETRDDAERDEWRHSSFAKLRQLHQGLNTEMLKEMPTPPRQSDPRLSNIHG